MCALVDKNYRMPTSASQSLPDPLKLHPYPPHLGVRYLALQRQGHPGKCWLCINLHTYAEEAISAAVIGKEEELIEMADET